MQPQLTWNIDNNKNYNLQIFITYKTLREPLTVKWVLPNRHSPQQLQHPQGRALPSDNWRQMYKNAVLWYGSISYGHACVNTATQQRVYSASDRQLVTAAWVSLAALLSLALASLCYKSLAWPPTQIRPVGSQSQAAKASLLRLEFRWHLSHAPTVSEIWPLFRNLTSYCTHCLTNTAFFRGPQRLTGYCTLFLGNVALFRATTSHRLLCTLPACSSVYSVNRRTFIIVLCGSLFKHRHPTTLYK
jgi:hypothetical protein